VATAPQYAVTPRAMCGLVPSTADTSFTAPTHVTSLGSAGTSGTKIAEIDVTPVGTTIVASLVNVFCYDGTTYHLLTSVTISAATYSTTAAPVTQQFLFDNLVLPSGWSLAISNTVAGNVSLVEVCAFGADL
jgi:hypothetical protein